MSKSQSIPLELGERPVLDVEVPAERIRVVALEPGGQPRVEVEGRREGVTPIEVRRDGERVVLRGATDAGAWPWPGASVVKRMTLVVPGHVRARIHQDFGQLLVERLAGCDLELAASAGTIELEQVRGRLKVVVDSGTVVGQGLGGTFDIVSQAGSVKLGIDALDAGEHRVRTAMGSVKLVLAPTVVVKLEPHTSLGSARLSHPSTPTAEAVMQLSADLGSIRVKTGGELEDVRHGDWPDWRRFWRDVAGRALAVLDDDAVVAPRVIVTPPPASPAPLDPEALRKVLELVEAGKLSAPDAERLIRAMGR
ncbi:MAG: hypothetical protein ACOZQL_37275 [Myxococcota bacterium]